MKRLSAGCSELRRKTKRRFGGADTKQGVRNPLYGTSIRDEWVGRCCRSIRKKEGVRCRRSDKAEEGCSGEFPMKGQPCVECVTNASLMVRRVPGHSELFGGFAGCEYTLIEGDETKTRGSVWCLNNPISSEVSTRFLSRIGGIGGVAPPKLLFFDGINQLLRTED